jgi:hypothetical protein
MKRLLYCFCFLQVAIFATAQRTLIAPAPVKGIYPRWAGGDREFDGHGPRVTGDVRVVVSEGKGQLIAFINLRFEETAGDHSSAEINETRVIYNAPAGKEITSASFPASLSSHFDYVLKGPGKNRVDAPRGGIVSYLMINGDTGGLDIGNNTTDDCFLDAIVFVGMIVDLAALPKGMREIKLVKTFLSGIVAAKLNGTTGKLNTFGPRIGDSWFKPRDSWMKFPNAIRPDTMFFDQLREIMISPRRYYYNDINLSNIRGQVNGLYIRLNVNWESNDAELRGECVNDVGCMFGSPTVQLDNFSIQINVRPAVGGGVLSYDPFDIQVNFSYNFGADCGILSDLCKEVFKDPLQNALFNSRFMLSDVLSQNAIRNEIGTALNAGVLDFVHSFGGFPGATRIVEVVDGGANLLIRAQ